jgi:hypothetical protein
MEREVGFAKSLNGLLRNFTAILQLNKLGYAVNHTRAIRKRLHG